VKLPSYKQLNLFLPYVVTPSSAKCTLTHPEGSVRTVIFCVSIDVDRTPVDSCTLPDAGSKPWLLAHALNGEVDPYTIGNNPRVSHDESNTSTADGIDNDLLPEDRFHIKLPKGVDQYTGVRLDDKDDDGAGGDAVGSTQKNTSKNNIGNQLNQNKKKGIQQSAPEEDELLPEDIFHKRDAASSVIIHQREQAIKDKWSKHEKYGVFI